MKPKILNVKFVISYFCELNCTYCYLTKEQRQDAEFLDISFIKRSLSQLVRFYKKKNYNHLIITLNGDELHAIPNFIDYLAELIGSIKLILSEIPKESIKIKMHTNLRAEDFIYIEQMKILEDLNQYAVVEFETVYQSMYHSNKQERKLKLVQELSKNIKYVSSLGLLDLSHSEKCKHLKVDEYYDFSKEQKYDKFSDVEINYIVISKNKRVFNGCGYQMSSHLFNIPDRNFCTDCPHKHCEMLGVEHRL